jgi:hypothetical protein
LPEDGKKIGYLVLLIQHFWINVLGCMSFRVLQWYSQLTYSKALW